MTLSSIFLWYNMVFCIFFSLGLVMILGMALGFADVGVDTDVDHDFDHDLDGDHGLIALLGFGRCPAIIILMLMNLILGTVGLLLNAVLISSLGTTLGFIVSCIVATAAAVIGTSLGAKAVAFVMPLTETTSVTRAHLIGARGTVVLPCKGDKYGTVQVIHGGDVFTINAYADGDDIAKNADVLIIDYIANDGVYVACTAPDLE